MKNMESEYGKFAKDVKEYLSLRYDLLRIEILEKLSKIIALIVVLFVAVVLGLAALIYFSFVFAFALKEACGSAVPGFMAIGGFFVLLLAVLSVFRKQIVLNPLIRVIGGILFREDKENDGGIPGKKEEQANDGNK